MLSRVNWSDYVAQYHAAHPGITEVALHHARHPELGTAHQWLAAAVPHSGLVLDIGAGSCPVQPHLPARSYMGVDRSHAELAAAVRLGRGPVQVGDAVALPVASASVDCVVVSMALMLMPLSQTLAEVRRVLRPGGAFVALLPATGPVRASDLLPGLLLSLALRGPGSMPTTLSPRRLRHALPQAGLRVTAIERRRFPFPVATAQDAELAVSSLYTPGRSDRQRTRAKSILAALPGRTELPVPLLRVTALRV